MILMRHDVFGRASNFGMRMLHKFLGLVRALEEK